MTSKIEKIKEKVLKELEEAPLSCLPKIQEMELPNLIEWVIKLTAREIFEDIEKIANCLLRKKPYEYDKVVRGIIKELKKEWGVDE